MKIKKLFLLVGAAVCCLTGFYSCKETPAVTYEALIPQNAKMVVDINLQSLLNKGGITDKDKQKLLAAIKMDGGLTSESYELVEQLIKDPVKFGLAQEAPLVFFFTESIDQVHFVLKLNNPQKLKDLLNLTTKNEHLFESVSEEDGLTVFAQHNEQGYFIIGETAAVWISGQSKEYGLALFKQKPEDSFIGTPLHKALMEKTGDIRAVLSYEILIYRSLYNFIFETQIQEKVGFDFSDMGITLSASAENGEFKVSYSMFPLGESFTNYLKRFPKMNKLEHRFLDMFPPNTFLYTAANMDGKDYVKAMSSSQTFKQKMDEIDTHHVLETLFSNLNGEVVLAVAPADGTMIPDVVCYAESKNADVLQNINDLWKSMLPGMPIQKVGKNEYKIPIQAGFFPINIYMGYHDCYLYFTNGEKYCKAKKQEGESLAKTEYGKHSQGKYSYFLLNGEAILNVPAIAMFSNNDRQLSTVYTIAKKHFKGLEGYHESQTDVTMHLYLLDAETNALKQVIDIARPYLGQ